MSEVPEDKRTVLLAGEAVAAGAAVGGVIVTDGGAAGFVAAIGASLVTRLWNAVADGRDARVREWIRYVFEGADDPEEMAAKIEDALSNVKKHETVRHAIMFGAKAAADTVDELVLPYIAAATRARAEDRVPLWLFRRIIDTLSDLDVQQVKSLRFIFDAVGNQTADEVVVETADLPFDGAADLRLIIKSRDAAETTASWRDGPKLGRVMNATRVFDAMRRAGLCETAGYSSWGGRNGVGVRVEVARLTLAATRLAAA